MQYGPFYPSSVVSDNSNGGASWSNPGNAAGVPDANSATATIVGEGITGFLRATGFNADIPSGKTISRVTFTIAPGNFPDAGLNVSSAPLIVGGLDHDDCYENGNDLYSEESLTPAQVNASDFGLALCLYAQAGGSPNVESIALYVEAD